ncbi:unnamed protein product, partial [Amoebophrya sp. A120]
RGTLLQVATGEGKTEIVAGMAVLMSLVYGKKVDIMTSSPVLAVRDAEKNKNLFEAFALKISHNTHKKKSSSSASSSKRACYESEITIGDPADFMFDALKSEWYHQKTTGNRYGAKYMQSDEVDMMLVNDLSRTAKVAVPFPGAEFLEPIYHVLKMEIDRLQHRLIPVPEGKKKRLVLLYGDLLRKIRDLLLHAGYAPIPGGRPVKLAPPSERLPDFLNIKDSAKAASSLFTFDSGAAQTSVGSGAEHHQQHDHSAGLIQIPKHWEQHIRDTIPRLVKSAMLAYFTFKENIDYVVEDNAVKPVSGATGITQESLHWSDGIHQTLEVAHQLPVTPESLPTNFLSNFAFFRRYKFVYGVTGTLGSRAVRNSLKSTYQLSSRLMPLSRDKRFLEYAPDLIGPETLRSRWVATVVENVVRELRRDRGVLCICRSIQHATQISTSLKREWEQTKVIEYLRQSNADVGEVKMAPFEPGMVIVSTNLVCIANMPGSGRMRTSIEQYGGLHVELTFLAESREEAQALGRTARQGKKGTGRITAMVSEGFGSAGGIEEYTT